MKRTRGMKLLYDPETDAMYLRFRPGKILESEEVERGIVFDFDAKGEVAAIEVLRVSERLGTRRLKLELEGIAAAV